MIKETPYMTFDEWIKEQNFIFGITPELYNVLKQAWYGGMMNTIKWSQDKKPFSLLLPIIMKDWIK